jgi:hypothetical protein
VAHHKIGRSRGTFGERLLHANVTTCMKLAFEVHHIHVLASYHREHTSSSIVNGKHIQALAAGGSISFPSRLGPLSVVFIPIFLIKNGSRQPIHNAYIFFPRSASVVVTPKLGYISLKHIIPITRQCNERSSASSINPISPRSVPSNTPCMVLESQLGLATPRILFHSRIMIFR